MCLMIVLFLSACSSKYDVQISHIDFEHGEELDTIVYDISNPHSIAVECKIDFNLGKEKEVSQNVILKASESTQGRMETKFPYGEYDVIIDSTCKPRG